jgi:hypothetical protein
MTHSEYIQELDNINQMEFIGLWNLKHKEKVEKRRAFLTNLKNIVIRKEVVNE